MKMNTIKSPVEAAEGMLSLGTIVRSPGSRGRGAAFAASSRNSWKRNSTRRLVETGMSGLGLPKLAQAVRRL